MPTLPPKKITSKIYYQRDSLLPATRLSTTRLERSMHCLVFSKRAHEKLQCNASRSFRIKEKKNQRSSTIESNEFFKRKGNNKWDNKSINSVKNDFFLRRVAIKRGVRGLKAILFNQLLTHKCSSAPQT